MNCIYITVFNHKKYVDMFYLLLESIFIYGNLDDTTHILVYTSTKFMNMIKRSHLFNADIIKFETNDTYDNIDKACKARLDVFKLPSIANYNKILYLDTDILVKGDINTIFNLCKEDIIYALEEGTINSHTNYWGLILFGNEVNNYHDITAFTSGILLFNNSDKMKHLFNSINEDIIKRPYQFDCYDQPYIVYNAFKHNQYNNKIFKSYVVNNNNNIHSDKIIHHFPGGPGVYQHKIDAMTIFLNNIKNITYSFCNNTLHIEDDIWTCSSKMRTDIADFFVSKKKFKIAEIGAHKGYSTRILSKIFSKVYAVDNSVEWTAFNKNYNKNATNIEYVMLDLYNDNWNILPDDIEVSFIDAGHSYEHCKSDIMNSIKQFKNLKYIILDDYGVWPGVKQIVDELINSKVLKFKKFIGIDDVPGPSGIVHNVKEGIICSVNTSTSDDDDGSDSDSDSDSDYVLCNKSYSWENSYIKFLHNSKMDAFGEGYYEMVDSHNIIARFGGKVHKIRFNDDYTLFASTREGDFQVVTGRLIV
jgi:hypothetical protein